jgi:hypothetical protein
VHPELSSYAWMAVTNDGGATWQAANLAFPPGSLARWRPTFFTEREAIFPVVAFGPAPQYVRSTLLFKTQDGGQSWTSTAVPLDVANADYVDLQHAVALKTGAKRSCRRAMAGPIGHVRHCSSPSPA